MSYDERTQGYAPLYFSSVPMINPWCACAARVTVGPMCVSTTILVLQATTRLMSDIKSVSSASTQRMAIFLKWPHLSSRNWQELPGPTHQLVLHMCIDGLGTTVDACAQNSVECLENCSKHVALRMQCKNPE